MGLPVLVALVALAVPACSSRNQPCQGSACGGAVTPVLLVFSCDDSAVVQSSLTGPCSANGFSCAVPDASPLDGCNTASFTASGPGQCQAQVTFANGFVYAGSFTFAEEDGGIVPTPEVVPVYCAPEDAGSPDAATPDGPDE